MTHSKITLFIIFNYFFPRANNEKVTKKGAWGAATIYFIREYLVVQTRDGASIRIRIRIRE